MDNVIWHKLISLKKMKNVLGFKNTLSILRYDKNFNEKIRADVSYMSPRFCHSYKNSKFPTISEDHKI